MKLGQFISQYENAAKDYLGKKGYALTDIKTGYDAWTVAHRSGITEHAYGVSRDVYDAHIQTVLEKIMPNAVFKDKKVY